MTKRMTSREIQSELCEMQQLLYQTDYIDNKINEALVFGSDEELAQMKEKYKETVANRKKWRARINELEAMEPEPDKDNE